MAYLQALRIEKARAALERGGENVSEISWSVGYQDLSAFSRVFKARTGLSPGAYRRRFHIRPQHAPSLDHVCFVPLRLNMM